MPSPCKLESFTEMDLRKKDEYITKSKELIKMDLRTIYQDIIKSEELVEMEFQKNESVQHKKWGIN